MTAIIVFLSILLSYNTANEVPQIQKIEFATSRCFGKCPIFSMSINADRTAEYNAIKFNKHSGKFKGQIKEKDFYGLIQLVKETDFTELKEKYKVSRTDQQTGFLTITYNDGKIKSIEDYGLHGTQELMKLYAFVFKLRQNQDWQPIF